MKTLSNNFNFLENFDFSNKAEIIESVIASENLLEANSINQIPTELRKILEYVFHDFWTKQNLGPYDEFSLGKAIKESIHSFIKDWTIINSIRTLESYGNIGSHSKVLIQQQIPLKLNKTRCISLFSDLHRLLIYYINKMYSLEIEHDFIEDIYFKFINSEKIITTEDLKKDPIQTEVKLEGLRADIISIITLLNKKNVSFRIPIYQRGYDWNKENIQTLFNDIEARSIDNSFHFFGTIACKKHDNCLIVLDGQQRLTTSLLIMLAANEIFKKNNNNWLEEQYTFLTGHGNKNGKSCLFINPGVKDDENISFKTIVESTNIEDLKGTKNTKFKDNYIFIYKYLEDNFKNTELLQNFIKTFIELFKINLIDFHENDCPIKKELEVFQNLNSKGKLLTPIDLIKNYLFNLCSQEALIKYENEIVKKYNLEIISIVNESECEKLLLGFYTSLINCYSGSEIKKLDAGQSGFLKQFIGAFEKMLKTDGIITEKIENLSWSQYVKVVERIGVQFSYWLTIKDPSRFTGKVGHIQSSVYKEVVTLITARKKNIIFSGILLLVSRTDFLKNQIDVPLKEKQNVQKFFITLLKLEIKHAVMEGIGDSDFARKVFVIFNTLIESNKKYEIDELTKTIAYHANSHFEFKQVDFMNYLSQKDVGKEWYIIPLLILTEWSLNGREHSFSETRFTEPTVEHLMPQSIEEEAKWIEDLSKWTGCSDKPSIVAEWKTNYQKIGNLLVLNKPKNSSLRNNSFVMKKEKLYKESSSLFKNNDSGIDISQKEKWGFDEIKKRTKELVKYISNNVINNW